MTDKIWQCCFTNTDHINGVAQAGPDLPYPSPSLMQLVRLV